MKRAFTLIEIMVVVAIVIVLVSLAVPSILRSRVVANEGAALGSLRVLNNACQSYHIDQGHYPDSLLDLANANPPYIDTELGKGKKQGYEFIYNSSDADHFTVQANPTHTGLLKGRYFFLDDSGTIRVNNDSPAGPNDQIVG